MAVTFLNGKMRQLLERFKLYFSVLALNVDIGTCVKPPIVKKLSYTSNSTSSSRPDMSGSTPVRLFCNNRTSLSLVSTPSCLGMLPFKKLPSMWRTSNFLSFVISDGIVPSK